MNLDMTVHIWKEDDQYVAHAMPLDVMSSGTIPQEAREALDEAVRVFLLTAADLGTLDQVLEESGYERQGERWVCPAFVTVERHELALAVQRCATATGNLRPLQSFGGATTRRIFD